MIVTPENGSVMRASEKAYSKSMIQKGQTKDRKRAR